MKKPKQWVPMSFMSPRTSMKRYIWMVGNAYGNRPCHTKSPRLCRPAQWKDFHWVYILMDLRNGEERYYISRGSVTSWWPYSTADGVPLKFFRKYPWKYAKNW